MTEKEQPQPPGTPVPPPQGGSEGGQTTDRTDQVGNFMQLEDLLAALSSELTALQDITKWALGFGFAATILAVQGDNPISVLNLQLTRTEAFFVISALYVAACFAAVGRFRRIAGFLAGLAPENIRLGYSKLEAHPWLFNPFVLSEFRAWKVRQGAISLFGLVCFFWLCLSGLYALLPDVALQVPLQIIIDNPWRDLNTWVQFGLVFAYLAPVGLLVTVGDYALSSIQNVVDESAKRMPESEAALRERLSQHGPILKAAASNGIGAGALVLTVVMVWLKWPW